MKRYIDLFGGSLLAIMGIVVYLASLKIRKMPGTIVGSDFFPQIAAVLLLTCGLILLIKTAAAMLKPMEESVNADSRDQTDNVAPSTDAEKEIKNWRDPVISCVLLAIYIVLLEPIGFLIMTFLYLLTQISLLCPPNKRRFLLFGFISLVATVFVYTTFVFGLSVMLPSGIFG